MNSGQGQRSRSY